MNRSGIAEPVSIESVLVMGVSGSGKSTVAALLAHELNAIFLEADDFHPASNRSKLSKGIPLSDEDRAPWLALLVKRCKELRESRQLFVLACSALKQSYRDTLASGLGSHSIVLLHGSSSVIAERLAKRQGHFANPSILESQLRTLELPKEACAPDICLDVSKQVDYIIRSLTKCA